MYFPIVHKNGCHDNTGYVEHISRLSQQVQIGVKNLEYTQGNDAKQNSWLRHDLSVTLTLEVGTWVLHATLSIQGKVTVLTGVIKLDTRTDKRTVWF